MNQRTETLATMHKALHSSDDSDTLFYGRKKEDKEDLSTSRIAWMYQCKSYMKRAKRLTGVARKSNENIRTNRTTTRTWKQKSKGKQLYGYFKRHTSDIVHKRTKTATKGKPLERN